MKKLFILRFLIGILILSVVLASCRKENKEVIEEIIEDYPVLLSVSLDGNTTEYDAYAAYCNENGIEAFSVSNNLDLLDSNIWTVTLAENDFIIHYKKDGDVEIAISGAAFETTIEEQPAIVVSNDSQGNITIEEANDAQIIGSMSGNFLINPTTQEFASYSVEFAAIVDASRVPFLCE